MKPQDDEQEPTPQFDPFDQFAFESYEALLQERTILFNGDVKSNAIEHIVLPLITMSQRSSKPIKLLIHSSGGDVEAGQAVCDAILTSRAPVIAIALGKAMSAAFDIFLSADKRIVYPNTVLMCHSGSTALAPQTLPQVNTEAHLHEVLFKRWASFYASRTKVSEKEWMKLLETGLNKYYLPEESVELGIAHEIIKIPKKSSKFSYKIEF